MQLDIDAAVAFQWRQEAVIGMAVYSAKAIFHGRVDDVWEMVVENIP